MSSQHRQEVHSNPYVSRPVPAFRVGVTGHVRLDETQLARIRTEVGHALQLIAKTAQITAHTTAARGIYAPDHPPRLRVLSPLAEGADRLVAEAGLAAGYQLVVAIPFDQAEYEQTFAKDPAEHAESVAAFRALLAKAEGRVLILDGSRDDAFRGRSYDAVGRLVVRNCDVLIAVWDEHHSARGPSGTTDIVHYALRSGVPVYWVHSAEEIAPRLLQDRFDIDFASAELSTGETQLAHLIASTIAPPRHHAPTAAHGEKGGWRRRIAKTLHLHEAQAQLLRLWNGEHDPLRVFLEERPLVNRRFWNLHSVMMDRLRKAESKAGLHWVRRCVRWLWRIASMPVLIVRALAIAPRFNPQLAVPHVPASALSMAYQHRYRTSYTIVFVCGAIALIASEIGLFDKTLEKMGLLCEAVSLALIMLFVVSNERHEWHRRYTSYRMLRELTRTSGSLAALGSALPGSRVGTLDPSPISWVPWLFAAHDRAAPMATGPIGGLERAVAHRKNVEKVIVDQILFHKRRAAGCRKASRTLGRVGAIFFLGTVVLVIVRIVLAMIKVDPWHIAHILSLMCAILPAAAAAVFSIRAYEEFEVLADESEQMICALGRVGAKLAKVSIDRPLASQDIAVEFQAAARIMLSEVSGWVQLFRMRPVDA